VQWQPKKLALSTDTKSILLHIGALNQ